MEVPKDNYLKTSKKIPIGKGFKKNNVSPKKKRIVERLFNVLACGCFFGAVFYSNSVFSQSRDFVNNQPIMGVLSSNSDNSGQDEKKVFSGILNGVVEAAESMATSLSEEILNLIIPPKLENVSINGEENQGLLMPLSDFGLQESEEQNEQEEASKGPDCFMSSTTVAAGAENPGNPGRPNRSNRRHMGPPQAGRPTHGTEASGAPLARAPEVPSESGPSSSSSSQRRGALISGSVGQGESPADTFNRLGGSDKHLLEAYKDYENDLQNEINDVELKKQLKAEVVDEHMWVDLSEADLKTQVELRFGIAKTDAANDVKNLMDSDRAREVAGYLINMPIEEQLGNVKGLSRDRNSVRTEAILRDSENKAKLALEAENNAKNNTDHETAEAFELKAKKTKHESDLAASLVISNQIAVEIEAPNLARNEAQEKVFKDTAKEFVRKQYVAHNAKNAPRKN